MKDSDKFLIGATGVGVAGVAATSLLTKKDGVAGFFSLLLWVVLAPIYDVCVLDAYFKGMGGFMTALAVIGAVIINGVMLYMVVRYFFKFMKFLTSLAIGTTNLIK